MDIGTSDIVVNQATLIIPVDGNMGLSVYRGLSDDIACQAARVACRTLSDDNQEYVVVMLSEGSVKSFSYDHISDEVRVCEV